MATMLFARPNGQWLDFPPLEMAAKSGNYLLLPKKNDLIPLPEGATLTMMPGAAPYGFDKENGEFILLEENPYQEKHEEICAIAALLPQGFSRSLLPAADDAKNPLPILGYTAVGISKGKLVIAAQQTDEYQLWHPRHYNTKELPALVEKRKKEFPGNSIIEQLAKCSLEYGCFTAQNIFYRRWEGGIPVSPQCNAHCLACISLQESQCCPSPQSRIKAAPQVREVVEIAAVHLAEAPKAIISFGQGCEGEPSLQFELIKKAIGEIRALTKKGIININTNAGNTQAIKEICHGGIDSMRVSLFSPIEEDYAAYHRPCGYSLADVRRSLAIAHQYQVPVALNLLAYPGYTDREKVLEALIGLCREFAVKQIQLRNLNIDPRIMKEFCPDGIGLGLGKMISILENEIPEILVGNYSRADIKSAKNKK